MAASGRVASLLVVVSLTLMPVQAELADAVEPPTDLAGQYDEETHELMLTWLPPNNTAMDPLYRVYQDSILLATTTHTNLTTTLTAGPHAFWVTAINPEGVESRPTPPVFAHRAEGSHAAASTATSQWTYGVSSGGKCEPIIVHHMETPPFVDVIVRQECLPALPCVPAAGFQVKPSDC